MILHWIMSTRLVCYFLFWFDWICFVMLFVQWNGFCMVVFSWQISHCEWGSEQLLCLATITVSFSKPNADCHVNTYLCQESHEIGPCFYCVDKSPFGEVICPDNMHTKSIFIDHAITMSFIVHNFLYFTANSSIIILLFF